MDFFRDAGKRLERFKQTVEDVAKEEAEYECRECGAAIYAEREDCPECGAEAVIPRDPETDGDSASGSGEIESGDEGHEDDARPD
ncbi:MAG: hypothetical protein ACOCSF_05315 [Halanaeroarchaeum sp.]